jgi:hypothetical protein
MLLSQPFRQYRFLWLLALSCLSSSCNSESNQAEKAKKPQTSTVAKPKLVYKPTGPNKAVEDLLPVNGDTLIAVKWGGGIAITTDAGLHWRNLHDQAKTHDFLFFKYLTIDQHHVLWGLDSWRGIHESDYSRLDHSFDFGETWKHLEFDTNKFFPYEFYSLPGKPLQVLTYNGMVSQMQDRTGKKWKPVKNVTELDNSVNDTIPGDSYFFGGQFKFLETGQLFSRTMKGWNPIVTARFINEVNDVCSCAGSTYVVGYNGAVSPTPHYLLRIANNQVRDTTVLPDEDQKYLRCDKKGRLWLFNFNGVWQKSGSRFLKRY